MWLSTLGEIRKPRNIGKTLRMLRLIPGHETVASCLLSALSRGDGVRGLDRVSTHGSLVGAKTVAVKGTSRVCFSGPRSRSRWQRPVPQQATRGPLLQ